MSTKIHIFEQAMHRIQNATLFGLSNLYGISYEEGNESKLLVMGFDLMPPSFDKVIYPFGVDCIGLLGIKKEALTFVEEDVKKKMTDIRVTNTPLFLKKDSDDDELAISFFHDGKFHSTTFDIMTSSVFTEKFCFLHLNGSISHSIPVNKNGENNSYSSLDLIKRISENMVFRVSKSTLCLSPYHIFRSPYSTIAHIVTNSTKCKDYRTGLEVLRIYGFVPCSERVSGRNICSPPFVKDFTSRPSGSEVMPLTVELPFDRLFLVHYDRALLDIYGILIAAIEGIIYHAEPYINRYLADPTEILFLQSYHFYPNELGHPVSLIFPSYENICIGNGPEDIHRYLDLTPEKPLFRREMALNFASSPPVPLMNVHIGLRPPTASKSSNTKVAFVYGAYEYYHYNMGGDNDSGWGCAYRSLQSIISWFRLQGYTSERVPILSELQEILVTLGDKKIDFIGSSTWIGSTEVSYVLQSYLEVSCKLISISKGSEMCNMGPVLYDHFQYDGTPVMIGGGVLAHTIIGVTYNENSGEVKFLILDPHYIGEDNITSIQKKGGVAWKGIDFWNDDDFYNLCLPQRPLCI